MNWYINTDMIGYRILLFHYIVGVVGLVISFIYFPVGLYYIVLISISGFSLFGMNGGEMVGVFYRNFYAHINIPRIEKYQAKQ